MKFYVPTGAARLRWRTKAFSTGLPTAPASQDYGLAIYRDGVKHRACQLSRATNDLDVQTTAFHYAISGAPYTKAAVDGTALPAGTIPSDATGQWGVFLLSIDNAGTFTFTAGAANTTTGYDNEAAALSALPATPAGEYAVGVVTVQAADSNAWVAGTDALAGGTGGTPAQTTNYYTLAEQLASESPAGALTDNQAAYGTGSHEMIVDIALAGGGADADGQDEIEVYLTAGTVNSDSVVGDIVGTFGVAADVLTTGVAAGVNAQAAAALTARFGSPIEDSVNGGTGTTSGFPTNTDQGSKVLYGIVLLTSGPLLDESKVAKWTGTQVTVLGQGSMDSAERLFSAAPGDGVTFDFYVLRA